LIKNKCIFLDRDGTLNKALIKTSSETFKLRPPYKKKELSFFSDIFYLKNFSKDYIFIILSNQPDLSSGIQTFKFHNYINSQIKKILCVKEFFFCTCHPNLNKNCHCYKPSPKMALKAINKFNISITDSYFIGDTWRDIKLANKLNIKSILIDRGYLKNLKSEFKLHKSKPNFVIRNFNQLKYIIK